MKHIPTLILIAGIIFLFSCTFEPKDEYFLDLEKPGNNPNIEVIVNINSADTVLLYWGTSVRIRLVDETMEIHQAYFFIDGVQIKRDKDSLGYYAYIDNLTSNIDHTLKIDYTTSSGSNSLADIYGDETYSFTTQEWILRKAEFDVYANGLASYTSQGANLSWKKYNGLNYSYYQINKQATNETFTTTDTFWVDNNYTGEDGQYKILVIGVGGSRRLWAQCQTGNHVPELRISHINNVVSLVWEPHIYENKIKEYKISIGEQLHNLTTVETVNIGTYDYPLTNFEFGDKLYFQLEIIPTGSFSEIDTDYFRKYTHTYLGEPFINYHTTLASGLEGLVVRDTDSSYFYDFAKDTAFSLFSRDSLLIFSEGAKYFASRQNEKFNFYSLPEVSFITSVNLQKRVGNYNDLDGFRLTENGILAFSIDTFIYIYDYVNDSLILTKDYPDDYDIQITGNAQYLILYLDNTYTLNEIVGDSLVEINTVTSSSIDNFNFNRFPNQHDRIYSYNNYTLSVRSIFDFSTISSYNLQNTDYCNIDFVNDYYMCYSSYKFYIYDLYSGSLLKTVHFHSDYWGESKAVACNNVICLPRLKYHFTL